MNTAAESEVPGGTFIAVLRWLRRRVRPRVLIVLTLAVLGEAAALNWGWLAAVGIAPLLLALAPCAAMCALGHCAGKDRAGRSTEGS